MAKKMAKTNNGATKVVAEVINFNPMLDVDNGYMEDELVASIKNKTMQSAVKAFRSATEQGQNSAWNVAKACARMKVDCRKEFENDETLARFLGLSNKMAFSRLYRLGALADEAKKLGLTTAPVQELLVLAGDKYGKLNPKEHLEAIVGMTKDDVREYVKQFKVAIEDKSKDSEDESENSEDKSNSDEQESGNAGDTEISWRAVMSVNADVLADLDDVDRDNLLADLQGIVSKYNLSKDDYWITTK